tara:strand:+ start:8214 stop:8507 length:294 start_codon:yes stop_codon:yes gene_type:complete
MKTRNDLDYANSQPNENELRIKNDIAKARDVLEEAGFYLGSLYHVDDVKRYFKCTNEEAMDVLDSAMDNDGTAETIWLAIKDIGEMMGLKEIEIINK